MTCRACGGSGERVVVVGDKPDVGPCPACRTKEIRATEERAKRNTFGAWKLATQKAHSKQGAEYVPRTCG